MEHPLLIPCIACHSACWCSRFTFLLSKQTPTFSRHLLHWKWYCRTVPGMGMFSFFFFFLHSPLFMNISRKCVLYRAPKRKSAESSPIRITRFVLAWLSAGVRVSVSIQRDYSVVSAFSTALRLSVHFGAVLCTQARGWTWLLFCNFFHFCFVDVRGREREKEKGRANIHLTRLRKKLARFGSKCLKTYNLVPFEKIKIVFIF